MYRLYYDFAERVTKLQSHQILAINRGEKEEALKVAVQADGPGAVQLVQRALIRPGNPYEDRLRATAQDAWDRLLFPSLEREVRADLTQRAQEQAIHTFALNLRPLLMQPPVKNKVILGLSTRPTAPAANWQWSTLRGKCWRPV